MNRPSLCPLFKRAGDVCTGDVVYLKIEDCPVQPYLIDRVLINDARGVVALFPKNRPMVLCAPTDLIEFRS